MTSRARAMLDALEGHGGVATRSQLWQHAGRYYLTNNAAAELRAEGVAVSAYDRDLDGYRLLDERHGPSTPTTTPPTVSLVEQTDGQYALDLGAAA